MGSISLLGGLRGSVGVSGGYGSIQSFLGQSTSSTFFVHRENERTASLSHVRAVESSESLSCSFSGCQTSTRNGARCGLRQNDSLLGGAGSARYSVVPSSNSMFGSSVPSRAAVGMSAAESCSSTSSAMLYPAAPMLSRGLEGTTARVLGLPNITGRFAPSLKVHRRLWASVPRTGGSGNSSSPGQLRRPTRVMAVSNDEGKKILSNPEYREAAEMQMMKEWSSKQFVRKPASESENSWEQLNMFIRVAYAIGTLLTLLTRIVECFSRSHAGSCKSWLTNASFEYVRGTKLFCT
jgi:hypothetical protein